MSEAVRQAAEPRLAASLLLVRDGPFEVLMVRRNARGQFASALVFPGGVVDPDDRSDDWLPHLDGAEGLDTDERALRIAAAREAFEETSVMVATDGEGVCPPLGEVSGRAFLDLVGSHGLRLRLDGLVPFGHWVTPATVSQRFDTHFYLARAPRGGEAVCDGAETVAADWANPHDVLARAKVGERSILFPTRMNLARLAESGDVASALDVARRRPAFTVVPRPEKRPDGLHILIPAEAGYPEVEDFHPRASDRAD